jgi:molybdenum-dependent DNA-binding transcriptional regulator ModE
MRFDLVDLNLFIAVAETRSITNGANRVHLALASASARIKGLEEALGVSLLRRGRRGVELTPAGESLLDHARIVMHNVDAMRGDLVAFSRGVKATIRFLTNTSACRKSQPKALAAFLASTRTSRSTSRSTKASTSRTPSPPAPPISGSLPNTRCPTASSGYRSAKTAWSWSPRARANWRTGGRSIFARWWSAISSA